MAVNIENIMNEIRQEIKEKGYTYDMLSFKEVFTVQTDGSNEVDIAEIDGNLGYLNSSYEIMAYRPLAGNKLFVFIKKVIRKLTKFYIEPIVASQNEFNAYNVRVLNALSGYVKKQAAVKDEASLAEELSDRMSTMELQLKTAASEIRTLNDRISQLEKENKELKDRKDR